MGMRVGEQGQFDSVLGEASLRLAEENMSYQELTWRLEQTLVERDRIAEELYRELQLAREVQKSILLVCTRRVPGVADLNLSAKAVSGDVYDYYTLADGRVVFCLADVREGDARSLAYG
jgi:serine phosphatase RsbU (regulator of sigma subunit)